MCIPVRSIGGFCCFSHFCVSVLSSVRGQWRFIAVRMVSEWLASGSAITGLKTPKHKCSHWRSPSPTATVWCLQRYCVLIGRAVVDYTVWLLSSAHRRPRKWLTPPHRCNLFSKLSCLVAGGGNVIYFCFSFLTSPQQAPSEWGALSVGDVTCDPLFPEGALCHHATLGAVIQVGLSSAIILLSLASLKECEASGRFLNK